jgi:CheY-like chemotaxis protein
LLNLLSNAVKFTAKGEIGLSFRATARDTDVTELQFAVWDSGIGIAKDRLDSLFLPFTQADNSMTRRFGGTGLGHSISKQLVEAMHGKIVVESIPEQGTTFRVAVQLHHTVASPTKGQPQCPPECKVLLAIRHPRIRTLLASQLQTAGYRPHLADSATQAWEQYCEHLRDGTPPAIVIVDQLLSDHDGTWLAARIRESDAPPPVLVLLRPLSGSVADADRQLFDRIINKPMKGATLLRALAELTRQEPRPAAELPLTLPSTFVKGGLRVLLVDDNAVNQKIATHLLKKLGAHIQGAMNGVEALNALRAADFDVVLMDCQMPEMDGYEATRRLRQPAEACRNPKIPVIALTANAFSTDREQCLAAGMDDFLTKPIERTRLEEALARVLEARERALPPESPAGQRTIERER